MAQKKPNNCFAYAQILMFRKFLRLLPDFSCYNAATMLVTRHFANNNGKVENDNDDLQIVGRSIAG